MAVSGAVAAEESEGGVDLPGHQHEHQDRAEVAADNRPLLQVHVPPGTGAQPEQQGYQRNQGDDDEGRRSRVRSRPGRPNPVRPIATVDDQHDDADQDHPQQQPGEQQRQAENQGVTRLRKRVPIRILTGYRQTAAGRAIGSGR